MIILIMEMTTGWLDAKHWVHPGSIPSRYLKFLSQKQFLSLCWPSCNLMRSFAAWSCAVSQATYDNHSSLNKLQAHHIDYSSVKSSNSRPRDRGRPRASKLPTGSCGVQLHSRVYRVLYTVLCFIVLNLLLGKKKDRLPIDHILLLRHLS